MIKHTWDSVKLGDVVDILDRMRVPVNARERAGRHGDVPYYGATGQVGWIDEAIFDEELVLVGEDGAPFFDYTRDVAYLIRGPAWVNNHAHVLRAGDRLTNRFLLHQLNQVDYSPFVSGTTRAKLPQGPMREIPLVVPSLAEQKAIVAAIETHFSRLDAAVASLTRAKANVQRARASVLKAAVEGRLVPTEAALARTEGRDYEPASALLARILTEREAAHEAAQEGAKRRKKYKPPVEPETEGSPELPEGWCWASCAQLLDRLQTGPFGSSLHKSDYIEGGTPVINPQHLRCFRIIPSSTVTVGPETAHRLDTFRLRSGDIVLGRRGEMGRCAVVGPRENGWILGTGSLALRLAAEVARPFFAWFLRSPSTVRALEGKSVGTTMTNLNQKILLSLPVPLPPITEQHRISAEVDRRLSVLDAIDSTLDANLARCERLRQSILKRAFEGRLVPAPGAPKADAGGDTEQLGLFAGATP